MRPSESTDKKRVVAFISWALFEQHVSPYWSRILEGVTSALANHGIALITRPELDEDLLDQVDGFLISASLKHTIEMHDVINSAKPAVSLLMSCPLMSSVVADNHSYGRVAVEYLRSLGHTKIGYLSSENPITVSADRLRGYVDAMTEAGLETHQMWISNEAYWDVASDKNSSAAFYVKANETVHDWLNTGQHGEDLTALIAQNGQIAEGAYFAILDRNLRIPYDFSMLCFDSGYQPDGLVPDFTSIEPPFEEITLVAVECLLALLDNTYDNATQALQQIIVPGNLHEGTTTGVKRTRYS
jgi:DNA-binding LacI/PurR family transcriptional regulator